MSKALWSKLYKRLEQEERQKDYLRMGRAPSRGQVMMQEARIAFLSLSLFPLFLCLRCNDADLLWSSRVA